jgi:hypothetical protein
VYLSIQKNDLDVYVQIRKAGPIREAPSKPQHTISRTWGFLRPRYPPDHVLKYLGPQGILRASNGDVAGEWTEPRWQTSSHRKHQPVPVGEPARLEVDI